MTDIKTQLQNIQQLRASRQQNDGAVYTAGINLQKAGRLLQIVQQKQTGPPVDPKLVASIKEKIAVGQLALQQLVQQSAAADKIIDSFNANAQSVAMMDKKITALRAQMILLNKQVELEQKKPNPDIKKIAGTRQQSDGLQITLNQSQPAIDKAKQDQAGLALAQKEAATKKAQLAAQIVSANNSLLTLGQQLTDSLTGPQISLTDAQSQKTAIAQQLNQAKTNMEASLTGLTQAIQGIYTDPHPRSLVPAFDDAVPFLLLPVRIETRFMSGAASPELWIRIYPDDIAIHTHEKTLTDPEVTAGENYWVALFNAEKQAGPTAEDQKKNAWAVLTNLFGPQRAAWVAKQTQPSNWSTDLSGIAAATNLIFPVPSLTKTDAWSRAPRVNVLPDKFVVMCYENGVMTKEEVGNLIPDELFMGPDPLDPDGSFTLSPDQVLGFGTAYDWTSNFDKAVQYGMGFKIPLNAVQAAKGFEKILVLGLLLSMDAISAKSVVEDLIDNHHYSPDGFSLLPQGTPTNNTGDTDSGYTSNDPYDSMSYFVETGNALFSESSGDCDGKNLADALGIDYGPLQFIQHADGTDHKETVAMNTALYPATLGYFFGTMMDPLMNDNARALLRDFFVEHVTGRGPLPAVRTGNQPYGVLLTSDFTKWQCNTAEPVWGTPFLAMLLKVLNNYSSIWNNLLPSIMYTGKPGIDPSDALINILGLQAGSVSFFQRIAYSTDDLRNQADFKYGGQYYNDLQASFTSKTNLLGFLGGFGFDPTAANRALNIPQQLRLVYQHYTTALDADNLVDSAALSDTQPVSYYDAAAQTNYLDWLAAATTVQGLEKQDFGPGVQAPTNLLYLELRRALLLELTAASVNWFKKFQVDVSQVTKASNFYNIRPAPTLTKWEVMRAKISTVMPAAGTADKSTGDYLFTNGSTESVAAFLNRVKAALGLLAKLPGKRLENCFTEHIDTCSYRLDAWQTALFNQRLQKQRNNAAVDGSLRKTGLMVGAFGWVENLKPAIRQQLSPASVPAELQPTDDQPVYTYAANGGFVHAPSLNHAAAAAVLRSGYLSHANADNPDLMAVNLSSERIRRALLLLDGIRNGQTLEALLGYQFERGLHDRGSANTSLEILNSYIYNFRDTFPLPVHKIDQQDTGTPTVSIPANNVVNGLALAETVLPYPYATIDQSGLNDSTKALVQDAINGELDNLKDSLDAVKDLLMSESVYQMVKGNVDRAAAVPNALKNTDIPPEIEIINTPRTHRLHFSSRVTIQFTATVVSNPWAAVAMTPRANMENGLNSWIAGLLGPAEQLVCQVAHTGTDGVEESTELSFDTLGMQPIDLVYIAGDALNTGTPAAGAEDKTGASELEARIAFYYRRMETIDDDVPVTIRFLQTVTDPGKKNLGSLLPLLKSLKAVITGSRSLNALDFSPPSKPGTIDSANPKGLDAAELPLRVGAAKSDFDQLIALLNNTPVTSVENGTNKLTTLGALCTNLNLTGKGFADIDFIFTGVSGLQAVLVSIAAYGVPGAFPLVVNATGTSRNIQLLEQARSIAQLAQAMSVSSLALITPLPAGTIEQNVNTYIAVAQKIFGAVFTVIPKFSYNNPADMQLSYADRDSLINYAKTQTASQFVTEEWIQAMSFTRPRLAQWEYIRCIYEMLHNDTLTQAAIQLPYRAGDNWLSAVIPANNPDNTPFEILHDTLSVVVHGDPSCFSANAQSGLLIDDWTEGIPSAEETTGISFNYNQPNAMAPQALLLAVPPVEKGHWDWDELVGILNDTLIRSKQRAVEPGLLDTVNNPQLSVLMPALVSTFSQNDVDLSLDLRNNLSLFAHAMPVTSLAAN